MELLVRCAVHGNCGVGFTRWMALSFGQIALGMTDYCEHVAAFLQFCLLSPTRRFPSTTGACVVINCEAGIVGDLPIGLSMNEDYVPLFLY